MLTQVTTARKNLLEGVNEPADPANLSDLERQHVPDIRIPGTVSLGQWFDVVVRVGRGLEHPSDRRHFIQSVEVYADRTFLARIDLAPAYAAPEVRLRVMLRHASHELCVRASCNVHGTWLARRDITVTD